MGFLMLQCEGCGAVHSFYTKHKLYSCHCNKCKTETPLEELIPVYMQCKCGRNVKYRTNLREPLVMGTCISCGKPVALRLNYRKTAYVTLGREGKR